MVLTNTRSLPETLTNLPGFFVLDDTRNDQSQGTEYTLLFLKVEGEGGGGGLLLGNQA